jgi:hypothetical protein
MLAIFSERGNAPMGATALPLANKAEEVEIAGVF